MTIRLVSGIHSPSAGPPLTHLIEDEIEAKFVVQDPGEAEQMLRAIGQLAELTAQASEQVVDLYIDSPSLELYATGLGCRIREKIPPSGVSRWSLECKAIDHGGDSIKLRQETRQPLPGRVSPEDLPVGAVRNLLAGALTSPATVILRLHNHRQHYLARTAQLNEFDVCIDVVDVQGPDGRKLASFREMEIELVRGEFADLQSLVKQLEASLPLRVSRLGKFERSLWLSGAKLRQSEAWRPDQPAWSLLVAGMRHDLRIIGLSRAIALEGADSEGVHLVRTHTRKLRAALVAATPWLGDESGRYSREFSELASTLSEVRDLDVYADQTMQLVKTLPDVRQRIVSQFGQALNDVRDEARNRTRVQLEKASLDSLFERFSRCLEQRTDIHADITVRELATGELLRRARSVQKAIRKLGDAASDQDLHRLRIRVKKLRYTIELFGVVFGEDLRDATRTARAVQDLLGEHQDACVAIKYGLKLASQLPLIPQNRQVLLTLGRLQAARERQVDRIRRSFVADSTRRDLSRSLKRTVKIL